MADSTVYRTCRNVIGRKEGIVIKSPTMTKQAFREECDINRIMARYELTGQIEHVNRKQPIYGDFSQFSDYQTMLGKVNQATEAFEALPSELRKELKYDPQNLFGWIQNPANKEKAIKYGLMQSPPPEKHNIQE